LWANCRLVTYLSRDDSVKSLLQWVISGLDELDEAAELANSASFDHAVSSPLYPSYSHHAAAVPGPGPDSNRQKSPRYLRKRPTSRRTFATSVWDRDSSGQRAASQTRRDIRRSRQKFSPPNCGRYLKRSCRTRRRCCNRSGTPSCRPSTRRISLRRIFPSVNGRGTSFGRTRMRSGTASAR